MAQVSPSIAAQLPEALQTGALVAVPVDEVLTHIAPTEYAQSLVDIARVNDPQAWTRREGKAYEESAEGKALNEYVERQLAERQDDDTFTASRDAVKGQILADMNAVGRFSEAKNEVDAMAYASYYAVRAAQMGVTPEELYARRRVLFAGRSGGGFEQALAEQPPKGWKHSVDGADASALWEGQDGTEAVFWTDLQGKLAQDAPALAGYSHSVDASAAQHIKSQHGDEQAESKRGQVGVMPEDVARIPDVVTQYDDARWEREDRGSKLVAFAKQVDDGVLVYLARVSDRRRNMAAVSMMKFKPGVEPSVALARALQEKAPHKAGPDSKPRTLSDYESDARAGNLGASINQGVEAKRRSSEASAVEAATYKFWERERVDAIRSKFQDEYDSQGTVDGREISHDGLEVDEDGDMTDAGFEQLDARAQEAIDKATAETAGTIESLDDIDRRGTHMQAYEAAKAWLDAMGVLYQELSSAGSRYLEISSPDYHAGKDTEESVNSLKLRFSNHAAQSRQHTATNLNWVEGGIEAGSDTGLAEMLDAALRFSGGQTGLGERLHFQSLWHGTPHRGIENEGFKLNKIGTGEGAQAYGWGIYGAESRRVADGYAWNLGRGAGGLQTIDGQSINDFYDAIDRRAARLKGEAARAEYDKLSMVEALMEEHASPQSVLDVAQGREFTPEAVEWFKKEVAPKYRGPGQLYSFEIPDDTPLLDWDKPLSEQPQKVREAVAAAHIPRQSEYGGEYNAASWPEGMTGGQWHGKLASALSGGRVDYDAARSGAGGGQRAASEYLLSIGIPGLRYLDGNSRSDGEGSHNYVIWDEALLTPEAAQIKAYYQSGLAPTAQAQAQWRASLANMSPRNLDYAAKMDAPAVLQAMGVSARRLELPTRYLLAIHEKHPDVPQSVFENLPALLADPLFVYPHKDGGLNVVIDTKTADGDTIVVGVRDGRIRTITPRHGEGAMPVGLASALERRGTRIYARNKEALANARAASTGAAPATIAMHRDSRSAATITTREHIVNSLGGDFNQKARGSFNPETLTVSLLKGADLSTALHEGAHFFFENDIMLASEILASQAQGASILPGEQEILNDVSALLKWHGIQGDLREQLAQWFNMSHEEKTAHHERTAESFERYLLDGKAPSLELQPYFQKFRAWMLDVYKSVRDFLAGHPEAGKLDDEVRQIFDRMLATSEQIKLAEESRSLMPLFTNPAESGMSVEDQGKYQSDQREATATAIDQLQARVLKDQQWRANARAREIKRLQRRHKALRAEMQIEARRQVLQAPIYRVYQFLTNKIGEEDKLPAVAQPQKTAEINPAREMRPGEQAFGLEEIGAGRLDLGALQEMYGAAPTRPEDFVRAPDGGLDFGEITPEAGRVMRRQAGKIHLQQGVQNPDGTGWGLAHIEANHGKQIRNAGFATVEQFIAHVAGSFNEVLQAAKGKQLLVAVTRGRRDVMFVQLEVAQEGDFYRVNTAFPASRDYLEKQEGKGAKILWSGSEPRSAATGQQPPYAGSPDDVSGQDAPIARGENSAPNQERAGPSAPVVEDNPPYPRGQSDIDSVSDDTAIVQTLKSRRLTAKNGLHPDIVAELFGFDSGDQMARALAGVPTLAEAVQAATDQMMLERHGDLSTPEAIERAADMAVHNEARARLLAAETNALEQAVGKPKTLMPLAKQYAADIVARLTIRKPWEQSIGPTSPEGKATVPRNAYQGGHRPMLRALAREVIGRNAAPAQHGAALIGDSLYCATTHADVLKICGIKAVTGEQIGEQVGTA